MPNEKAQRREPARQARQKSRSRNTPAAVAEAGSNGAQQPRRISIGTVARIAAALALLAGLTVAGIQVYHSPIITVSNVEVSGTRLIEPAIIAAASAVEGENILTLDSGGVRQRLLGVPLVKSVEVSRRFPNTVLISVEEREPWGYWESGGGRYVIDQEGIVLNRGLPAEGAPLVMQLEGGRLLHAGDSVDPDALYLTKTLRMRLSEAVSANRLPAVAFEFRDKDGLTVTLRSGLRVTFGDSQDLDFKLAALKAVLARAPDATFVDLRFGDRIVFHGNARP